MIRDMNTQIPLSSYHELSDNLTRMAELFYFPTKYWDVNRVVMEFVKGPPSLWRRRKLDVSLLHHDTRSSLRSFRNMYLLKTIQHHRNHTIWLLCAFVMALQACGSPCSPEIWLRNSSELGDFAPGVPVLKAHLHRVGSTSRNAEYLRSIGTDVRV